ncbi:MAG TPA: hypothetical protein VHZ76_03610 [Gammaproteobacteria bacterium]|nr:hypothetical protein [Gammaproteobacteria bacterium]
MTKPKKSSNTSSESLINKFVVTPIKFVLDHKREFFLTGLLVSAIFTPVVFAIRSIGNGGAKKSDGAMNKTRQYITQMGNFTHQDSSRTMEGPIQLKEMTILVVEGLSTRDIVNQISKNTNSTKKIYLDTLPEGEKFPCGKGECYGLADRRTLERNRRWTAGYHAGELMLVIEGLYSNVKKEKASFKEWSLLSQESQWEQLNEATNDIFTAIRNELEKQLKDLIEKHNYLEDLNENHNFSVDDLAKNHDFFTDYMDFSEEEAQLFIVKEQLSLLNRVAFYRTNNPDELSLIIWNLIGKKTGEDRELLSSLLFGDTQKDFLRKVERDLKVLKREAKKDPSTSHLGIFRCSSDYYLWFSNCTASVAEVIQLAESKERKPMSHNRRM